MKGRGEVSPPLIGGEGGGEKRGSDLFEKFSGEFFVSYGRPVFKKIFFLVHGETPPLFF